MNKKYSLLGFVLFICMLSSAVKAQVLVTEDFEGGNSLADFPQWTTIVPPFELLDEDPCEGSYSLRTRTASGATFTYLEYVYQAPGTGSQQLTKIPTGEDIEISFDYKLVNFSGGSMVTGNFGTLDLYYTIDGGANWVSFDSIDQTDLPTSDCSTYTFTIPGTDVPAGSDFGFRLETNWNQGDYYVYFDNFNAIEQVNCIAPLDLEVDESTITFDGAEISWNDLNNASEWTVYYCPVAGNPVGQFPNPTCNSVTVTGNPETTLTGLVDGQDYFVYVVAECGAGVSSAASYVAEFQTIAIGTDCTVPIEINNDPNNPVAGDLPYTDSSNTDTYGNSLTGQPGANCGGSTTSLSDSYDVVYHYTTSTDDILTVTLSGLNGVDNASVLVYQDCADIGSFCIAGGSTDTASDIEVGSVFVDQGEDYYIIVTSGDIGAVANTPYTLGIEGFDCSTWVAPDGNATLDFVAGQTLADFSMSGPGINPTINGATLTWYEDDNGSQGSQVTTPLGGINLNDGDVYYVTQNIGGCESPVLQVTFDEFDCLTDLGGILTSQGDSTCESGVMNLEATANNPSNIYWYDSATGGEVIAVGSNFTTPNLTQTTSYWATEVFIGESEIDNLANPGPVTSSTSSSEYGLTFNAAQPFTLVSVDVYVAGTGNANLELVGPSGQIETSIVPLNSGSTSSPTLNTVNLNWEIPTSGTYTIRKVSGPAMMYTPSSSANFPYSVSTVAEITSGATTSSTSTSYYYFYNWTVTGPAVLCESPREEVEAVVYNIEPITLDALDDIVCVGSTTDITASSTDTDYQYTWTWTDANGAHTDTGSIITPTIIANTTFTVEGYNPNTTCSTTNTIEVEANGIDNLGVIPNGNAEICSDEIISLTAGSSIFDFNDGNQGWTTQNASTDSNQNPVPEAGWQNVVSPYTPTGYPLDNISSPDNSNFFISTADKIGPGGDLDTYLISPSFNFVGTADADITFDFLFKDYGDNRTNNIATFDVLVSIDQGPWTEVEGNILGEFDPSGFTSKTINIGQFSGSSDVRIAFNFNGTWGWWLAIDNVIVERQFADGFVAWSPINDLYFDQEATIPYDGSPVNEVYFTQSNAGQYSYTALLDFTSCPDISSTVDITVNYTDTPTTNTPVQNYVTGETIGDLEVSGTNLKYYILDGDNNYIPITINYLLQHGQTYYITQTTNNCESDFLEITVELECPQPINVNVSTVALAQSGDTANIVLEWDEPNDISTVQDYVIEIYNNDTDQLVFSTTVESGDAFEIINGLPIDTNLRAEMYSICDSSIPVESSTSSYQFNTNNLSVGDVAFTTLSYYPNPFHNEINFENSLIINTIEVYNMRGQRLFTKNINSNKATLSLEQLSSGVYFASIYVENAKKIVRLIKE